MAVVRCPPNVSSITLATSGVLAPAGGLITCTALEATSLCNPTSDGGGGTGVVSTNLATGATDLAVSSVITSITINGNVYPVVAGKISAVPAADVTIYNSIERYCMSDFQLVTG